VDTAFESPLDIPQIELLELVSYLHLRYGDPARALAYLKLLKSLLPSSPRVMRSQAIAHLRLDQPALSESYAGEAIGLDNSDRGRAASQFILGVASSNSAHPDTAAVACQEFRRIRTQFPTT
jgi:uncharacterized protein (DUF58 family)